MPGELRGKFSGLMLDMDGVLYRGNHALPGARELFPALRKAGLSFILLTNNSTLTQQQYADKLASSSWKCTRLCPRSTGFRSHGALRG